MPTSRSSLFDSIDLTRIDPNPYQARNITFENVADLAQDIYENGLLQIPLARRLPNGHVQLAFGHRRFTAYQLIFSQGPTHESWTRWSEFAHMPLIVKPLTDLEMYIFMAAENGQRENPNVIEIAESIALGRETFGLTLEESAKSHGMASRGQAFDIVQLLTLPRPVQQLIRERAFGNAKGAGQTQGKQLVRLVKEGVGEETIIKLATVAVQQQLTTSVLKTRVEHEIVSHRAKNQLVTLHCPRCGAGEQVSQYDVISFPTSYWKCQRCNDRTGRLNTWLTSEDQAEKEKKLAASAATVPLPESSATPAEYKHPSTPLSESSATSAFPVSEVEVRPPPPPEDTAAIIQQVTAALAKLDYSNLQLVQNFITGLLS